MCNTIRKVLLLYLCKKSNLTVSILLTKIDLDVYVVCNMVHFFSFSDYLPTFVIFSLLLACFHSLLACPLPPTLPY